MKPHTCSGPKAVTLLKGPICFSIATFCLASLAPEAAAQATKFSVITGDQTWELPTTVYVGDPNTFSIIPADTHGAQIKKVTWTVVLTAPSGAVINPNPFEGLTFPVHLGQLGTIRFTAKIEYQSNSGGYTPATNELTASISVLPPTGVRLKANMNPDQNKSYKLGTGDYFFFQIVGGTTNNGYHMQVEEKMEITKPVGQAPPFGGNWAWNGGPPGQNAPYIEMRTNGEIRDLKILNENTANVPVGESAYELLQTIGVRVQCMDQEIRDIELGKFKVKHIMTGDDTYRTVIEQQ